MSPRSDAYYRLRPDVELGPPVDMPEALAQADLTRGTMIDLSPSSPLVFTVHASGVPLPHWLGDRVPLVSQDLLSALTTAGVDNFQTFPAVLRDAPTGASQTSHVVLNVLGLVDAAHAKSTLRTPIQEEQVRPRIVEYLELVLDHSRTRDLAMFRLADDPTILLIHDRVMRVLSSTAPAQGWGFTATEIELC